MVFLTPEQLTEMLKSYEQSYAQFKRTVANERTLKDMVERLEYALQESVARVTKLEAELDRAKPLPGGDLADFTSDEETDDDDEPDVQRNPLSRGKRARIDDSSDDDDEPDVQPPLPSAKRARVDVQPPLSSATRATFDDSSDEEPDDDDDDEPGVQPPLPGGDLADFTSDEDDDDSSDEDESVNMWKENEPPASNPNLDQCEACDYFAGKETYTGFFCMECGHDGTAKK